MAKYTIELRNVCKLYGRDEVENWFKDYRLEDYLTSKQIEQITNAGVWSKDRLATKIVDHYYMREIGLETPGLFKHYAKVYMQEIMERKLPKIYSNFFEYDPLSSVDYTEEYTRQINTGTNSTGNVTSNSTSSINSDSSGSSNSNSSNSSSGLTVSSDTPEGQINKEEILNGKYASSTSASETESQINDSTTTESNSTSTSNDNSSSNSKGESSSNTVETYTHTMKGDNGVIVTNQYLIREYREIIVAIDEEIINELSKLFMGIY